MARVSLFFLLPPSTHTAHSPAPSNNHSPSSPHFASQASSSPSRSCPRKAVLAPTENRSSRPFFLLAILDGRLRHRSHHHHRRRSKTLDSEPPSPSPDKIGVNSGSSPAVNSRDHDRQVSSGAANNKQQHDGPSVDVIANHTMAGPSKSPSPPPNPTKASLKAWWRQFTFVQKAKKEPEAQKGVSLCSISSSSSHHSSQSIQNHRNIRSLECLFATACVMLECKFPLQTRTENSMSGDISQ